jgi:uncharacterized phage protein (TIGR02218 family)
MTFAAKETSGYEGAPLEFYKFTSGATIWRYTSGDVSATIPDPSAPNLYTPEPIARDPADFSGEDTAGNVRITVGLANPVAQLFIAYTPPAPVTLTIFRKHRTDAEVIVEWVGEIVSASFEGAEARLTCAPVSGRLLRRVPCLLYQPQCNWPLYSASCGIDKDSWKDAALLSDVTGSTITSTTFDARADGWYVNGWVERTNGERRFVVNHVGAVLTLMSPFIGLEAGETVTAYAGCQRTEAECISKFDNLAKFMGWSRIPTRNPYSGGSIV